MKKVEITKMNSFPICPYCEKELEKIATTDKGTWEKHIFYCCPYCKKILGIGNIDLY